MYVCVPCMCLVSTEARKRSQAGPLALEFQVVWAISPAPRALSRSRFPIPQIWVGLESCFDRLWEGWQYTSTREPVKLEFYLGNPRPPSCGTVPNKGLHRGRSSAILCSQNEPSPFTDLPSECSHGSRQNQQKNLSRGPTKEWKVL